jgi:hypothetical protein
MRKEKRLGCLSVGGKKLTAGKLAIGALGLIATGFFFAVGYGLYGKLFSTSAE